jgi:nucleotide-binding universal stress UspA family protein
MEATMTKPTRILVPTDFSGASDAARVYATVLAEAFDATLHILHVIPDPLTMGWGVDAAYLPQLLERIERDAQERLDKMLTTEVTALDASVLGREVLDFVDFTVSNPELSVTLDSVAVILIPDPDPDSGRWGHQPHDAHCRGGCEYDFEWLNFPGHLSPTACFQ